MALLSINSYYPITIRYVYQRISAKIPSKIMRFYSQISNKAKPSQRDFIIGCLNLSDVLLWRYSPFLKSPSA